MVAGRPVLDRQSRARMHRIAGRQLLSYGASVGSDSIRTTLTATSPSMYSPVSSGIAP